MQIRRNTVRKGNLVSIEQRRQRSSSRETGGSDVRYSAFSSVFNDLRLILFVVFHTVNNAVVPCWRSTTISPYIARFSRDHFYSISSPHSSFRPSVCSPAFNRTPWPYENMRRRTFPNNGRGFNTRFIDTVRRGGIRTHGRVHDKPVDACTCRAAVPK